jgi:hypothetical protein
LDIIGNISLIIKGEFVPNVERNKHLLIINTKLIKTNIWVLFYDLVILQFMTFYFYISRSGIERDTSIDWYLKPPHIFLNKEKTGIVEVSSTDVRNTLKYYFSRNDDLAKIINPVEDWVDSNVYDYILKNELYK